MKKPHNHRGIVRGGFSKKKAGAASRWHRHPRARQPKRGSPAVAPLAAGASKRPAMRGISAALRFLRAPALTHLRRGLRGSAGAWHTKCAPSAAALCHRRAVAADGSGALIGRGAFCPQTGLDCDRRAQSSPRAGLFAAQPWLNADARGCSWVLIGLMP